MSFSIGSTDVIYRYYRVTAKDHLNRPTTFTSLGVALLPVGTKPSASTVWTPVTVADGRFRVLLAGFAAPTAGAFSVPAAGADLWMQVVDNVEIDSEFIEHVEIE